MLLTLLLLFMRYFAKSAYEFEAKVAVIRAISPDGTSMRELISQAQRVSFLVAQPHRSLWRSVSALFRVPTVEACAAGECDGTENQPNPDGSCEDQPPGNTCRPWECTQTGNYHKMCTGPYFNSPACTSCRFDHNVGCKAPPPQ